MYLPLLGPGNRTKNTAQFELDKRFRLCLSLQELAARTHCLASEQSIWLVLGTMISKALSPINLGGSETLLNYNIKTALLISLWLFWSQAYLIICPWDTLSHEGINEAITHFKIRYSMGRAQLPSFARLGKGQRKPLRLGRSWYLAKMRTKNQDYRLQSYHPFPHFQL